MAKQAFGKIIEHQEVAKDFWRMKIEVPEIAAFSKPGQFVHVRIGNSLDPLLRRPISLHDIDPDAGIITLLYQLRGKGTRLLKDLEIGDRVDLMGPLGTGWSLPPAVKQAIVVGGGCGVAPLLPLVKILKQVKVETTVMIAARACEYLISVEELEATGAKVLIATDDGSRGHKGYVTELLDQELRTGNYDFVYGCGPEIMLEKVVHMAREKGLKGEVSLEERMGCGVGACLSCVCKVKVATETGWTYKKACTEGPVFDLEEVLLGE